MNLTLWLTIVDGTDGRFEVGPSTLWYSHRATRWLPTPDTDRLILWPNEDDPMDGPLWGVKSRHMDADGGWHVDLATMVLDPPETEWRAETARMTASGRYHKMWWNTRGDDGSDPTVPLSLHGWRQR